LLKDAYYFSHDSNASRDEKILEMRQVHGWAGYGIYWALIEMLRDQKDFKLRENYKTIAFALQADEGTIKSIVEDFGLFKTKDGFFFSESLLRRMELKAKKSKQAKVAAKARWNKDNPAEQPEESDSNADAEQAHSVGNASKVKETKVKETKVKETKVKHTKPEADWPHEMDLSLEAVAFRKITEIEGSKEFQKDFIYCRITQNNLRTLLHKKDIGMSGIVKAAEQLVWDDWPQAADFGFNGLFNGSNSLRHVTDFMKRSNSPPIDTSNYDSLPSGKMKFDELPEKPKRRNRKK